jgi:hypothetical protein
VRADGSLEPWATGNGPLWRRWAMSEVKVSSYHAPEGSIPVGFEAASALARADWGRREQERKDLIILPLVHRNEYFQGSLTNPDGRRKQFIYMANAGLQFDTDGETK